jgi:hypothetical protein
MNKIITLHRLEDGSGIEFEAELNGEFIGYYNTRQEAEAALDARAYELLELEARRAPMAEDPTEQPATCNPDYDELEAAYQQAASHDMSQAWRNALDRAFDLLLASDGITVEYAPDGSIAVAFIPSQTEPGTLHHCNGDCDCTAAQHGNPCTHRAAKRLLCICHDNAARLELPTRESQPVPAALTCENALPAWATRARPDLLKDED